MKKLDSVIYNKLLLQAEEAKEQGMIKLADAVFNSIGPLHEEERVTYNLEQLEADIHGGLWKLATCIIKYHDVNSLDAEKVNEAIESLASKMIKEVEQSLGVENDQIGKLEDKLPGEL